MLLHPLTRPADRVRRFCFSCDSGLRRLTSAVGSPARPGPARRFLGSEGMRRVSQLPFWDHLHWRFRREKAALNEVEGQPLL